MRKIAITTLKCLWILTTNFTKALDSNPYKPSRFILIHGKYLLARFDHGIGFSIVKKCNVPTWIIRTTADTTGDLDEGAFGKNAVLGSENGYI